MRTLIALAFLSWTAVVSAAVVDSASDGFTVTNTVVASVVPDKAYDSILKIGNWWSSEHTYFHDAKHLSIDPNQGGCFCEIDWKRQVRHGTVIFVDRGKMLRLSTALGPLQEHGVSGVLTFKITPAEKGADIEMTYRVGGYFPGGLDKIAPVVDQVLGEQLARLERYINTGSPEPK